MSRLLVITCVLLLLCCPSSNSLITELEKVIPTVIKNKGPEDKKFRIADHFRYHQNYELAIDEYQKALETKCTKTKEQLYAINQIAYCNLILNRDSASINWIGTVDSILYCNPDSFPHQDAIHAFNKGRLFYLQNERDSATHWTHQGLKEFQLLGYGDHLLVAQSLTLLSLIYFEEGLTNDSCAYYAIQANDIFQSNSTLDPYSWESDFAQACYSLMYRAHELGERYCRSALVKIKGLREQNPLMEARCWSMLGNMLKKQGDALFRLRNEEAIQKANELYFEADSICFHKAVEIGKSVNHFRVQEVFRDRVIFATRLKNADLFFKYLSELKKNQGKFSKKIVFVDRLLGYYYCSGLIQEDSGKCIDHYSKLLAENIGNENIQQHLFDESYFFLINAFRKKRDYIRALEHGAIVLNFLKCNNDCESDSTVVRTPCLLYYGIIADILVELYFREGDGKALSKAYQYYTKIRRDFLPSLIVNLDDAFLDLQLNRGKKIFSQAIEVAFEFWKLTGDDQWVNEAFTNAEQIKAQLLYRNILSAKDSLDKNFIIKDSIALYQGRLARAIADKDQASEFEALNRLDSLFQIQRSNSDDLWTALGDEPMELIQIQDKLESKEAVVQFIKGNRKNSLFGIYIDKKHSKFFNVENDIDSIIQRYRNSLVVKHFSSTARQEFSIASRRLYEALISPFANELLDKEKLIIIPDEILNQIPFEPLLYKDVSPDENLREFPYLLNQLEIIYTPSWKVHQLNRNKEFSLESAAIWVDPILMNSTQIIKEALLGYSDIRMDFYRTDQYGKVEFKNRGKNYDLLHLSLHASSDQSDRYNNRLFFNNSIENTMTSAEITKLNLSADLLVMAACETAFGITQPGEGTYSITRSFMQAGIPQVVSTLWRVNEFETAKILNKFYSNLSENATPSAALRTAKLHHIRNSTMQHYASPNFWAGLILTN